MKLGILIYLNILFSVTMATQLDFGTYRYDPYDIYGNHSNYYDAYPEYRAKPIEITSGELKLILGTAASAIVVFNYDQDLNDFIADNRSNTTQVVSYWGEKMGSVSPVLGVGGYVVGVVFKNGKIKRTSLLMMKSYIVSGLITRAAKMTFSRKRPNKGQGPYEFGGPDLDGDLSFPSGHTTTAFTIATVIAESFKDKSKMIPVLAYGAAAIGGWSRMHDNAHWASDVLVGALIGHLTAKVMMRKEFKTGKKTKYDMSIYPVITDDYVGVQFEFRGKRKKDDSAKKFHKRCHKFYEENPPLEDPRRLCFRHYLEAVWEG